MNLSSRFVQRNVMCLWLKFVIDTQLFILAIRYYFDAPVGAGKLHSNSGPPMHVPTPWRFSFGTPLVFCE